MILAIDLQGAVVGMACMRLLPPTSIEATLCGVRGTIAAYEEHVAVHSAWRGHGLYGILCRCRWLVALRMGASRAVGHTLNPVAAAARLRMGYTPAGSRYLRLLSDITPK
jgi:hypothetical protein